jgi:hypothetical protein
MPSRRQVLTASGGLWPLCGCLEAGSGTATIVEVVADLVNGDDEAHVFRLAIETARGLGEWHSREVAAGTREETFVAPPDGSELVAVHGIVDDRPVRVGFSRIDFDGDVCPHVRFSYRSPVGDGNAALVETADASCRTQPGER